MSYFNRYLLGGYVAPSGTFCTTDTDPFGDGSDLALYRFQGNAVDDANGNNGTPTDVGFSLTNGDFRGSAAFPGAANQEINTSLTSIGVEFTLSFWIKRTAATGSPFNGWFDKRIGTSMTDIYCFCNTGTEIPNFQVRGAGGITTLSSPASVINVWEHYVFTYSGTAGAGTITLYKDGVPVDTSAATHTPGSGPLYLGNANPASRGPQRFQGFMDQVRVFNRGVDATEAASLYDEYICQPGSTDAFSTCTTDTVGYPVNAAGVAGDGSTELFYKLDGNSNDSTTNGRNGTDSSVTYGGQGIFNTGVPKYAGVVTSNTIVPAIGGTVLQNDFSVSLWFKTDVNSGTFDSLLAFHDTYYLYIVLISGQIRSSIDTANVYSTTNFNGNRDWNHLVITKSSTAGFALYINGIQEDIDAAATGNAGTNPGSGNNRLGSYDSNGNNQLPYNGYLDQLRIIDSVLTAAQAKQLYDEVYCDTGCTTETVDYQATAEALYRLDGDGNDDSTNSRDLTINGSPTFSQGKYDLGTGNFSAANYWSFPDGGDVFNLNNKVFTLSLWLYSTNFNSAGTAISKRETGSAAANRSWLMQFSATGAPNFITSTNNTNAGDNLLFTTNLTDGEWNHVVVTGDGNGGTLRGYVNGVAAGTVAADGLATNANGLEFRLGQRGTNGGTSFFNGSIDQVRYYNSTLSAAQITNLYNEISCS